MEREESPDKQAEKRRRRTEWLLLLLALLLSFGCVFCSTRLALNVWTEWLSPASLLAGSQADYRHGPRDELQFGVLKRDAIEQALKDQTHLQMTPIFGQSTPVTVAQLPLTPTSGGSSRPPDDVLPAPTSPAGTATAGATPTTATATAGATPTTATATGGPTPTVAASPATGTAQPTPTPIGTPASPGPTETPAGNTPGPAPSSPTAEPTANPTTPPPGPTVPPPGPTDTPVPIPTATDTPVPIPTATDTPTPVPSPLIPILGSVLDNGDGTCTAWWGYDNPNATVVTLLVGADNSFNPASGDRGQPTTFNPGTFGNLFSTTFSDTPLTWWLDGTSATANPVGSCLPWRISGMVFEDVNYLGGAGTPFGAGDAGLPNVQVELYNWTGLVTTTTTNAAGQYVFGDLADGPYTVRVVSASIGDGSPLPAGVVVEQTYEHNGLTGNGDFGVAMGGNNPTVDDTATPAGGGVGDTNVTVTVSGANVIGVDLGFADNVVVNTLDTGQGSLRQTLLNSNALAGQDTVVFNIPGATPHTIAPASLLPALTGPVIIDGTTQPGFGGSPVVVLDGSGLSHLLSLEGGNSTVRGLVLNRSVSGIRLIGDSNTIQGNYIGTDVLGASPLGGSSIGIYVPSSNNLIGGSGPGEGNIIAAYMSDGIYINGGVDNVIEGNYIGTNDVDNPTLGNGSGVSISYAQNTTVGGATADERNFISGNQDDGVYIESSTGSMIQGNYIGTTNDGSGFLPNQYGITLSDADNNTVADNLISGNSFVGLRLLATSDFNTVRGNLIGTRANGTQALPNITGLAIQQSNNNTIGGTTAAARNLISGNVTNGISIVGTTLSASNNVIQGNYIGTDINGTTDLPNVNGIEIVNAGNNRIGGTAPGAGNLISGNSLNGIHIETPLVSPAHTWIEGNIIGMDATGMSDLQNVRGIDMHDTSDNTIGGADASARNIISGNGQYGLYLDGASQNVIQNNYLGPRIDGSYFLNAQQNGIYISNGNNNLVGDPSGGASNLISSNMLDGIVIIGEPADGNRITGNSIYSNGPIFGLGINLGTDGVTPNDPDDPDTGPNEYQNYPVLISITPITAGFAISGTLDSTPDTTYTIEFFASSTCWAGRQGGEFYLGSLDVTTDPSGDVSFTYIYTGSLPGSSITATATDPNGNTSEFSQCIS